MKTNINHFIGKTMNPNELKKPISIKSKIEAAEQLKVSLFKKEIRRTET